MDQASVDLYFESMGEDFSLIDPEETDLDLAVEVEDEDQVAALDELEGEEYTVAYCRALYDLNELTGGFCCQAIGVMGSVTPFMTSASGVTLQEEDPIVVGEAEVTWGAEAFASASSIGASIMTLAATALVFAQWADGWKKSS